MGERSGGAFLPGAPRVAGKKGRGAGQARGVAARATGAYLRPRVAQAAAYFSVQISSTV